VAVADLKVQQLGAWLNKHGTCARLIAEGTKHRSFTGAGAAKATPTTARNPGRIKPAQPAAALGAVPL
jgi:hypothetical protein